MKQENSTPLNKSRDLTGQEKIYSQITYWLGVVAVGLAVGLSIQFAVAWQEPTAPAPGGNLEAPINVSDITQSKGAGLVLNSNNVDPEGLIVVSGKVGIGTTNPDRKLVVNGGIKLDGGNIHYIDGIKGLNSGGASVHIPGKVGIGTKSPSSELNIKLDVKGDIVAGNSSNWDNRFKIGTVLNDSEYSTLDNTDGPWLYFIDDINPIWFDGSVGVRLGDKHSAKFIVGKAKNTYGPISCSKLTETSDLRYKKDIKTIENVIDRIKNIRGVDFKLRDNNDPSMGVIAQEVEKDFPSLVSENEYGYKLTNYSGFIGVLIEAVKEQQEQIEKLQEEVESLK